jgi:16S rRNA (guanine527-N7)-methyltransferase
VEQLITGAKALHIPIQPEHLRAFRIYQEELLKWNERFNLTAITDDQGVQIRHFLDSLSCCLGMGCGEELRGQRVIDVGAGAGFPGLPLKILQPGLHLTLIEATGKKTRFLRHLVERLGLEGVTILHERAETLGQAPAHRERYDWVIARAVADTPILMEYLLPLANVGGQILAQKGEGAPAEVQRSEWTIKTLGGHVRRLVPVELHGLAETRYLVLVDKVARTPPKYPRRPGMPSKRPLTAD